ncbi:MAG: hypothetical protein WCY11_15340 [Novosphingobium sp.]
MSGTNLPAVFATFDRDTLASAVEVLVAVLDAMDGDPDQEDATDLEDDFALSPMAILGVDAGPGCKLSDPREDDDPSGQCDEDEINTHFLGRWNEGPGCPISDPDCAVDDRGCDPENEI